jgi:hypothetical protein
MSGREGEGVEPSRRRVAPPTGFEARPPHQGRFPPTDPMRVVAHASHGLPGVAPNSIVSGRSRCLSCTRRV